MVVLAIRAARAWHFNLCCHLEWLDDLYSGGGFLCSRFLHKDNFQTLGPAPHPLGQALWDTVTNTQELLPSASALSL